MKFPRYFAFVVTGWFLSFAASIAEVTLPHVFSDHMVLQQGADVPVWGSASPG